MAARIGRPQERAISLTDGEREGLDRIARRGLRLSTPITPRAFPSYGPPPAKQSSKRSAKYGGVGITGINIYSLIVAVVGSVVVLWVYNAVSGRRAM